MTRRRSPEPVRARTSPTDGRGARRAAAPRHANWPRHAIRAGRTGRPRGTVSLARALSKIGLASRTDARAWILAGRVRVNGRIVTAPERAVRPEAAIIEIDGHVRSAAARRVIAFHKPRGVVTTRRDPEGRPTVFDVLGDAARGLMPIGRLDMASTGLLLLTNDTRLGHALTDPANRVPRAVHRHRAGPCRRRCRRAAGRGTRRDGAERRARATGRGARRASSKRRVAKRISR